MKRVFLVIFWCIVIFLVAWFYYVQIPSRNAMQYNDWLKIFQEEISKDKNLSNRDIQISIISKSSPELQWQINQHTKDITPEKIIRLLNQLKIIEVFNNNMASDEDDLLVQVEDNGKVFQGRIHMNDVKNNIRVKVLFQLLDAYK